LESSINAEVRKIIFASSGSSLYGNVEKELLPLRETIKRYTSARGMVAALTRCAAANTCMSRCSFYWLIIDEINSAITALYKDDCEQLRSQSSLI
jgi:nucleoside-diphosphate-sugar epimerase